MKNNLFFSIYNKFIVRFALIIIIHYYLQYIQVMTYNLYTFHCLEKQ